MGRIDIIAIITVALGFAGFIAAYWLSIVLAGPFVGGFLGLVSGVLVLLLVTALTTIIGSKIESCNV